MPPILFFNCSGRDGPDFSRKRFDSLLIENGIIVAADYELETVSTNRHAIQVDLGGAVIVPAFVDSHVHLLHTALGHLGTRLQDATSLLDVFDRLRDTATHTGHPWVLAWEFDENRLAERRLPTRAELDAIEARRPVWVSRVDLHSAVGNSAACAWARSILPEVVDQDGRFAGVAYNTLSARLFSQLPKAMLAAGVKRAVETCYDQGVATVHALEGGDGASDDLVGWLADLLADEPLQTVFFHQSTSPRLAFQRRWPRLGGCMLVDGSIGSRTAAVGEAYADDPGNHGEQLMTPEQVTAFLTTCVENSMQSAMHAIGDRAIEVVTTTHRALQEKFPVSPLPHRIEHFILPTDRSIKLAKQAGLALGVQPVFEHRWGGQQGMYAQRLGARRAARANPWKTLVGLGIPLIGGSDSPVTPIEPWAGIHAFCNHHEPDESLDLNSAIHAFTLEPHQVSGTDRCQGRLRKGFRADFTCLDSDPFLKKTDRLHEVRVSGLVIGGQRIRLPAGPT
jgi:predicted amidohydrolase YtcJ